MPSKVQAKSVERARKLRRDMTDGERRLWAELRQFRGWFGIHVRRQVPIGPYVADFAIHGSKLVIEVDGEHHQMVERLARDGLRDRWMKTRGYTVLRFNTGDLETAFDGCIERILHVLGLMRPVLIPQEYPERRP